MRKSLIALMVLLCPLVSAQYQVQDFNGGQVVAGDKLGFEYNTSRSGNYSIDLLDSKDDVILSNVELPLVFNSTEEGLNSTYYVYRYNYTLGSARPGEWESNLFDGFNLLETETFRVEAEELRILSAEDLPFFKNPQDEVRIQADLTDVGEDVDTLVANVNISNDTKSMQLFSDGSTIDTYSANFGKLSQGTYSYFVDLIGDNGTSSSSQGTFQVYSSTEDADRAEVTVGISTLCSVNVRRFRPPGGGILPVNGTGSFVMDIRNNATAETNVSGELWVTYENKTPWEPEDGYDELGPQLNLSYRPIQVKNLSAGQTFTSVRSFNDSDETGYYAGHLNISARCPITQTGDSRGEVSDIQYFEDEEHNSFKILVAGGGSGGSGNPVANRTRPEDVNQTGEDSNETIQGDSANPGQTPVPEPQPQPVPEPVPDPVQSISLNIEAWNNSAQIPRGSYSRIEIELENFGNQSIGDLNVSVLTDALPGEWDARGASVANLSAGETVNRSVFVRPAESVTPGTYRLSMMGSNPQRDLDIERVELTVKEEVEQTSTISISEAPQVVRVGAGGTRQIPLLIRNVGSATIENSSVEIQNLEDCGNAQLGSTDSIAPNESVPLSFNVTANSNIRECNSTLIVSTSEGSYSFAQISFQITADEGIVPPEMRFPVFASAWTILLIIYSITMTRLHLDTLKLKIPYLILIIGEAAILFYISSLYGVIPPELLPF